MWLKMAADLGYPLAQAMIAARLLDGNRDREDTEARQFMRTAARSRDPETLLEIARNVPALGALPGETSVGRRADDAGDGRRAVGRPRILRHRAIGSRRDTAQGCSAVPRAVYTVVGCPTRSPVVEALPMHIPSLQNSVSAEEWQLRCDLAACYRLIAAYGWSDLVFTHVSARIPGPEHHFLINPYGLMFDEITASSLVKVDQECNKLSESPLPVNPAGFVIHSAIHAVREDAGCVLHTHSRAGVGVSAQKCGVLPISQQSTFVLSSLAYHDYEGVALRDDEKSRLQADLGTATFLMLRNHGLLTVGRSIPDAFLNMYVFENTCRIQVDAQAGGELIHVNPAILAGLAQVMKTATMGLGSGVAWPALLRKVERMDPGYRT